MLLLRLCGVGDVAFCALLFDCFNSSTADILPDRAVVFLLSKSFLKSMRLVLGVPSLSEHVDVDGTSTLFDDQLCRDRDCCCGSKMPRLGVDRPELIGELPCDLMPGFCIRSRDLKSSVSEALAGDIWLKLGFFCGVEVENTPLFRGSMGDMISFESVSSSSIILSFKCDGATGE